MLVGEAEGCDTWGDTLGNRVGLPDGAWLGAALGNEETGETVGRDEVGANEGE